MFLENARRKSLMTIFFAVVSCLSMSTQAKSNSYVLQCRGGGSMYARIYFAHNVVSIFGLKHSRFAAGKKPPSSGECAWLDRPMSANEPYSLYYNKNNKKRFTHVDISSSKTNFEWSNDPINTVIKKMKSGQLFYVHVKNIPTGERTSRTLQIERVGP